jgi:hypothetical protein
MIPCYTAGDAQEASLLVLELRAHGIDALSEQDGGAAAFGDLPASVLHVRIHVPETQLEQARSVLAGFLERRRPSEDGDRTPWTCAGCGEPNDATFDVCWSCQAAAPGTSGT